jgi:hypothetical protein
LLLLLLLLLLLIALPPPKKLPLVSERNKRGDFSFLF